MSKEEVNRKDLITGIRCNKCNELVIIQSQINESYNQALKEAINEVNKRMHIVGIGLANYEDSEEINPYHPVIECGRARINELEKIKKMFEGLLK